MIGASPSSRGRGLKYDLCDTQAQEHTSPSLRGRGLKYCRCKRTSRRKGRPLCEGVD